MIVLCSVRTGGHGPGLHKLKPTGPGPSRTGRSPENFGHPRSEQFGTYHSFGRWFDIFPFNRWSSFLKESLEQIGKRIKLIGKIIPILLVSIVNKSVQLRSECGLCVLSHQLLEFHNRFRSLHSFHRFIKIMRSLAYNGFRFAQKGNGV